MLLSPINTYIWLTTVLKFSPEMVNNVPPIVDPLVGVIELMTNLYWNMILVVTPFRFYAYCPVCWLMTCNI